MEKTVEKTVEQMLLDSYYSNGYQQAVIDFAEKAIISANKHTNRHYVFSLGIFGMAMGVAGWFLSKAFEPKVKSIEVESNEEEA